MGVSTVHSAVADRSNYKTVWTCEKWSEDAVDFGRAKLEKLGVDHLPAELTPMEVAIGHGRVNRFISEIIGRPMVEVVHLPRMMPISEGLPSWFLRAAVREAEEVVEIEGNLLLNNGIARVEDLTMIATPLTNQTAGNAWGNTNAFLGVGTSSTAEAATQTALQAGSFYKAMNATYPSRSNQTVSFQSDFTSTEANQVWAEWGVTAGATTASGAGFTVATLLLNRKVAALGTKSTGTWTLTGQITFS